MILTYTRELYKIYLWLVFKNNLNKLHTKYNINKKKILLLYVKMIFVVDLNTKLL